MIERHIRDNHAVGEFTLPGLLKIKRAKRPATKERTGRNPATGEEIVIGAKPASIRVRVTALKRLRDMIEPPISETELEQKLDVDNISGELILKLQSDLNTVVRMIEGDNERGYLYDTNLRNLRQLLVYTNEQIENKILQRELIDETVEVVSNSIDEEHSEERSSRVWEEIKPYFKPIIDLLREIIRSLS